MMITLKLKNAMTSNVQVKYFSYQITRDLNFWCDKVFEGGKVTFLIYFENAVFVHSIFVTLFLSNCDFGAF